MLLPWSPMIVDLMMIWYDACTFSKIQHSIAPLIPVLTPDLIPDRMSPRATTEIASRCSDLNPGILLD